MTHYSKALLHLGMLTLLLVGMPLIGAKLAGKPLTLYLGFPPLAPKVVLLDFSWPILLVYGLVEILLYAALVYLLWPKKRLEVRLSRRFPGWGLIMLAYLGFAWYLAWQRPAWAGSWLNHTFTLLWLGYIGVVNALCVWRGGWSLLTHRLQYFLGLFPLSALFWWYFEYLNRFVGNWHYVGVESLTPWQYFIQATLPFSTVLPAVISTMALLSMFPLGREQAFPPLVSGSPRMWAWLVLFFAGLGLVGVGRWPQWFFPLLWCAPLLLFVSLQVLLGEKTYFAPLAEGRWEIVALPALAALVCGFFWEMWNYWSVPKWVYTVPFVSCCKIFEMPLLGYAGYLPFGLECAVIAHWWARLLNRRDDSAARSFTGQACLDQPGPE